MTTKPKKNRATKSLKYTNVLAGIAAHITAAVVMGGKSLTPQAIAAVFQAALQALADLDAARSVVDTKLQAKNAAVAAADAMLALIQKYLGLTYANETAVYSAFGLEPPKAPEMTAATKAAAAAKGRATRARKKAAAQAAAASPAPETSPSVK